MAASLPVAWTDLSLWGLLGELGRREAMFDRNPNLNLDRFLFILEAQLLDHTKTSFQNRTEPLPYTNTYTQHTTQPTTQWRVMKKSRTE